VGVGLLLAALPWWLDLILPRLLSGYGISYSHYERVGYTRFALSGLTVRQATWNITLDRVETATPLLWCWQAWRRQSQPVVVGPWQLTLPAPATSGPSGDESGWVPLRRQLLDAGQILTRWLPELQAGAGRIILAQGRVELDSLSATEGELRVRNLRYQQWHGDAAWTLPVTGTDPMKLRLTLPDNGGSVELVSTAAHVQGTIRLWQQEATVTAEFAPTGWWPTTGLVRATDWNIPGDTLGLGARYARMRGHGSAEWKNARFTAELAVEGEPQPGQSPLPFHALLQASGDAAAVSLDRVEVMMPGLSAQLSEPVRVDRHGVIQPAQARFTVAADLAALPWGFDRGRVEGEAHVAGDFSAAAGVAFSLTGTDVARGELTLPRFAASAQLAWPLLQVQEATLIFSPEEHVTLHGGYDFRQEQIIAAEANGTLATARLRPWLTWPGEAGLITFSAAASGARQAPVHHGHATLDALRLAPLKPLALAAEWQGVGAELSAVKLSAQAGASTLLATGSLNSGAVKINSLQWTREAAELLRLSEPVVIARSLPLATGPIRLAGPLGHVQLQWTGSRLTDGAADLQGISSAWLADLLSVPGPAWTLQQLQTNWATTPTGQEFSLRTQAQIAEGLAGGSTLIVSVRHDEGGIRIEQLDLTNSAGVIVHATGRLPLNFHPAQTPLWSIQPNGVVSLELLAQPVGSLLDTLNRSTGLTWDSPRISAQVSGTWAKPSAALRLDVARVTRAPVGQLHADLLNLENVSAALQLSETGLVLEKFTGLLGGQPIRASGRLALPADGWPALVRDPLTVARDATELDLSLPETDLTAWARDWTTAYITKGRIQAEIHLRPGPASSGWVRLTQTNTRPIGPLGTIQDLSAELQLTDDTLVLSAAQGNIGGQPVRLSGRIVTPFSAAPQGELALTGTNIPLVRQKGLLVRADLELQLTANGRTPPHLGGRVLLRDSLLFADVRDMAGSGAPNAGRAPYFSVTEKNLRDWSLAVQVTGERFLRIRSPVFNGLASARFKFGGTLGDPRALGEAVVNEGYIVLPFVTFRVQQGRAELSLVHPFDPQLLVKSTARSMGYDLRMEVSGAASAPKVTFTSSPALDAKEALLLVLAGEAPRKEITSTNLDRVTRIGSYVGQRIFAAFNDDPSDTPVFNLTSGEKISRQGRQTYRLEYELNQRWSLLGEYDEFDEYNTDLKWKVPYLNSAPAHADK
jgi:translocation and assembly module TamB